MDMLIESIRENKYLLFMDDLKRYENPWDILDESESLKRWLWNKDKLVKKVIETYYDKRGIKETIEEREVLKDRIEVFFQNVLGDKYSELDEIRDFYEGYNETRKTKKRKEEFQKVSEKLKLMSEDMQIDFGRSFELIYSIKIFSERIELNMVENQMILQNYLDKYKELDNKINDVSKEINKKIKNAKKAMDDFLKKRQIKINKQDGKYYKKWSLLTDSEKNERIESYAVFYCRGNGIEKVSEMIEYININKVNAKDIKWNIKNGIITDMNIKFQDNEFVIVEKIPTKKKKVEVRFDDKNLNDILLLGIMGKRELVDLEIEIADKYIIKKLNKMEKDLISERYNEFIQLVNSHKH